MENDIKTPRSYKRLLALAGAGLLGVAALSGCNALSDAVDDASSEDPDAVNEEAYDAAADVVPGDCLTVDFMGATEEEFTIPCDDEGAYWEITEISADTGATATGGTLSDNQPLFDLCGEEVGAITPGSPVTDWNMVYDETTGNVDYLYCTQAIGGIVADAGECFSSSDFYSTAIPCDDAEADTEVASVVSLELGEYSEDDLATAAADCTSSASFPTTDQFGRSTGVFCIESLM
ncbi:hypothetical protein [Glycomyces buryatensis]|uniref:Septum formation-related domain-containing protein n=1 Tax=Glycomyces buryatensis TaxID=2570927 RepID=A0A4S8Q907_9ACTN|nr:hypothetical protein [Glycomyces buryatensis]THV40788.1 hypothetical protein FAB82_14155 [Glycomyces buryatensis]